MIEYIIAENPDDRILKKASELLHSGKVICFPTDTNWILACDPHSPRGVELLYRLKGEEKKKHFSLLCDSISRASELAIIDDSAFKIIKRIIPGHYTFIFEATKTSAKFLKATKVDKEIGIRFTPTHFVQELIKTHGDVLMSTNVTHQMLGEDEGSPIYSYMLDDSAMDISLILDPGEFEFAGQSTIVDFTQGFPEVIREGAGSISSFT